MKHWLLLLVFLLSFSWVYPQNIIPRFENIGVNDGLSQSSVYSIYQDKAGFMWFGTADGLNRYDGQTIRIFKIEDKKIANSNFIHGNICEDSKGRIWFCNETGLFYYDPLTDKLSRKITFEKYGWSGGIFIDDKDIFYIINPMKGIFAYNIGLNSFTLTQCRFKTPYYSFVAQYLTTNFKNAIWIKTPDNKGLIYFDTQNRKVNRNSVAFKFNSIFYTKRKKLYFLDVPGTFTITDTALNILETVQYKLAKNKSLSVQGMCSDNYDRTWISTLDNGLICFSENSRLFTQYVHDNSRLKSLTINILSVLCIDHADNLWIGSDGGGVCKLDLKPPKFNLFPLNEGDYPFMKDYFIKCFYEDRDGSIWFGTHSSGLNIYYPKTGYVKNYNFRLFSKKDLPGPIISNIFKDIRGLIWITSSTGVTIFDKKNSRFSTIKILNGPTLNEHNNFVYKLIQAHNGNMVAATIQGLMTIRKIRNRYTGVFGKMGPENNILTTDVVEMADGSFWASSPLHGLIRYKKENDNFVALEKRFPLIDLRSIHKDEQNNSIIWICTGIGLIKFNTVTKKHILYDEKSGMLNSYVYGLLEDEQHNFWMSTNMGLCFFNRTDNTFQNYTAKDGLQSNEFNTQAFYKSASGNLYFGGIRGFNWFNPKTIKNAGPSTPGVAITSINVDDVPYHQDQLFAKNKTISLNYNHNNISFQFAALDFTKPQANKIKFILENWDHKWITSYDKTMRYSNISPGTYLLRIKASNSDGTWSNEEKLNIIINAPFWRKTWFYIISILGFLATIVYFTYFISQQKIKKKLRALEKKAAIDAERNRISRDMHDEIGSGLTHIALLSELIQTQQKTSPAVKNDLGNIAAAARKLVESINEIIWALNPQNDSLENLLSYIREQMQQNFEPFQLNLKVDFPEDVPPIKLSNEQRRNLYLVTKEALNNVMKHAHAKNVSLSLCFDPDQLSFEVTDDGVGLTITAGKHPGNGLKNMRKRMEDICGTIDWINQTNGLSVVYKLKINKM